NNILKIVKDHEVAKDILQEVFIALWEKRDTIKVDKPVSGWLFVISFNKSVNYLKKRFSENSSNEEIETSFRQVSEDHDREEKQYQLLQDAIAQLSNQKSRVFTMCKLQGKSYEETALALNISKYTVKEYLSLAMEAVKAYVKIKSEALLVISFLLLA